MDNEELIKYVNWMQREYGPEWKEVLNDQLRTNQFGDHSPNYSFAEKTLPSDMGLLNSREEINQVLGSKLAENFPDTRTSISLVDNPEYPHIQNTPSHLSMMSTDGAPRGEQLLSEAPFNSPDYQLDQWGQTSDPYVFHTQDSLKDYISENFPDTNSSLGFPSTVQTAPQMQAIESSSSFIPAASSSLALEAGPSGYPSVDAAAGQMYGGTGISEELASQTAAKAGAESAWGGPATFAGNMALNMIPTRDRNKVNTPLGDEGSMSGILKGTGKGALLGGTISGGNPYAIAGGAALGALGGASGYFDSTSAPVVNISRVRRRGGGMQGGLLGGGSMYG